MKVDPVLGEEATRLHPSSEVTGKTGQALIHPPLQKKMKRRPFRSSRRSYCHHPRSDDLMIRVHALDAPLAIKYSTHRFQAFAPQPIPYDPVRNWMEQGKGTRLDVGVVHLMT